MNIRENKSVFHSPLALYLYLNTNTTWATKFDDRRHKCKSYWYKERKLIVADVRIYEMVENLNTHKTTIIRWINRLIKDNLIRIIKDRGENLYILGYVDDEGRDILFNTIPLQNREEIINKLNLEVRTK